METSGAPRIGVALATRDRRELTLRTVARLRALPERPPVVVADDGSRDGTAAALRAHGDAGVEVVALPRSVGAAARTAAVRRLATPYVALSDDDSWWEPGALARAAALFDAHPRLGLIAAAVVVGPQRRPDPTCAAMASGPLACARGDRGDGDGDGDGDGGPGVPVVGFVACGAIVRRSAYLAAGGFHRRYEVGGEEQLLALDLAAAGWQVRHVAEVVACHWPPGGGAPRPRRVAGTLRNDLWTTWLRRPLRRVPAATVRRLRAAGWRRTTVAGVGQALAGLPWVAVERRVLPPPVERDLRLLERAIERGARPAPARTGGPIGRGGGKRLESNVAVGRRGRRAIRSPQPSRRGA